MLLSLPPATEAPRAAGLKQGQARPAWCGLFISAPDVQLPSDIKYPSLKFLSLSLFGHTGIFHESPFIFELNLRTLFHWAHGRGLGNRNILEL